MELPYLFIFGMDFPRHRFALFIYIWDGVPRAWSCLLSFISRLHWPYTVLSD